MKLLQMEKLTLFCQIAFFKTLLINVYYFGFNFWKIPILVYRHTHLDYRRGKMTVTFPPSIRNASNRQMQNGLRQSGSDFMV